MLIIAINSLQTVKKCRKTTKNSRISNGACVTVFLVENTQRKGGEMRGNKKKHTNLEILTSLYRQDNIPAILYSKDKEGRYIYVSKNADAIDWIDGGKENSLLGKTAIDVIKDREVGKIFFLQDQKVLKTGKAIHTYSKIREKDKERIVEVKKNPVYANGELLGISGIVNDVTEQMELKRKFEELTYIDNFTQCYNRNYFLEHDFDKKKYLPCTYIMCDCNNLKEINDHMGHKAGDQCIQSTVEILKSVLPEDGICVRWGGDEFLMMIPRCGRKKCEKILEQLNQKEKKEKKNIPYLDIAKGSVVRYKISQPEDEVIEKADQEMYKDKRRKKALYGNKKGA